MHKVSPLSDCYFAGAVDDVSVADFLLFLLWLFLWCDLAGAEAD